MTEDYRRFGELIKPQCVPCTERKLTHWAVPGLGTWEDVQARHLASRIDRDNRMTIDERMVSIEVRREMRVPWVVPAGPMLPGAFLRKPVESDLTGEPWPEPEHTSRDPWPEGFPVPRPVLALVKVAEVGGWDTQVTYARGYVKGVGSARNLTHTVVLRAARGTRQGFIVYQSKVDGSGKWTVGRAYLFGEGTREWVNVTAFKAALKGSEDG